MCFYVNIVLFREHVDLADGSVLNGKPVEMVRRIDAVVMIKAKTVRLVSRL